MISENLATSPNSEEMHYICDRLKAMGYAESKCIRIYGEEIEVTSNPFPDGNGIAVRGISKHEASIRIVRLPLPVVQAVMPRRAA